jgi:endonuclease YncB( thermonuclease family)
MTERQYVYKIAEVVKVVDGDSYWLRVDVGFRQENLINVRLAGFDCPEAHRGTENEKAKAILARKAATSWLDAYEGACWIRTEKDPDNFGRWLGTIWVAAEPKDFYLGETLRELGLASLWPIRWRDAYDHLDAIPVETSEAASELRIRDREAARADARKAQDIAEFAELGRSHDPS